MKTLTKLTMTILEVVSCHDDIIYQLLNFKVKRDAILIHILIFNPHEMNPTPHPQDRLSDFSHFYINYFILKCLASFMCVTKAFRVGMVRSTSTLCSYQSCKNSRRFSMNLKSLYIL